MLSHSNSDFLPPIQANDFLPPISRWTTFSGLFAICAMGLVIPLASVTKYKVTVKAQAIVRPAGELRIVQAATEGPIMHINVKDNQVVKKGDVIAIIDDSHLQTKKSQLQSSIQQANLQLVQINAQISALNSQIRAETNRNNRAVDEAGAELRRRRRDYRDSQITTVTEVQEAAANLRSVEVALKAARSKRDRYKPIAEKGAISKNQLEEAQLEVEQQQQAVMAAAAKLQRIQVALNPSDAEVASASFHIAQEQATGSATLASLNKERLALLQQSIEIQKQLERDSHELRQVTIDLNQTTITATADGIISKLNLRNPSQTVHSGEEIAQIVPTNAALEVKAAVVPKDKSKLKLGQNVLMRISACPYPDYGTLKGKVKAISPDATTPQSNSATATAPPTASSPQGTASAAFYEVTIEPESLSLGRGEHQCSIQPGMEGRADIISKEETVLQFFLRKARLVADL
jgi:HlyD family type I secretion membrane fusion protein